jgi:hypothetical protein
LLYGPAAGSITLPLILHHSLPAFLFKLSQTTYNIHDFFHGKILHDQHIPACLAWLFQQGYQALERAEPPGAAGYAGSIPEYPRSTLKRLLRFAIELGVGASGIIRGKKFRLGDSRWARFDVF